MTDRKTGATPEQIEAALQRRRISTLGYGDASLAREAGIRWAAWLVPDTHRIVAVSDLRALYDWAFCGGRTLTRDEAGEYLTHDERGIADRIEALIGDER